MPMPPQLVGSRKGRKVVKVGAMTYAKLLRLLLDGGYTLAELAEETGLHYLTVCDYTTAMYKEKVIHIAGWAPDARGRVCCRVYKIGAEKDAKRTPLTKAQRQAKRREKLKLIKMNAVLAGQGAFVAHQNTEIGFVQGVIRESEEHPQAA
jgi:hypothetical protein